jgi:thiol-disulfide isomerase/thioredoxin
MKHKMACFALLAALAVGMYCAEAWGAEAEKNTFPVFSAQTLGGDPVTDAIFATQKLTMVNIWATWCPPCRRELPDLGRLGNSMPEGTQLIGLLLDVEDSSKAKKLLENAKADFLQILYTPQMKELRQKVQAIPTTVFVDAKGRIVGNPIVGSRSEAKYRAVLEETLERVERRIKIEESLSNL